MTNIIERKLIELQSELMRSIERKGMWHPDTYEIAGQIKFFAMRLSIVREMAEQKNVL